MHEHLFGERPAAEALIAEHEGEPAGYALFFATFSTFLADPGHLAGGHLRTPRASPRRHRPGADLRASPRLLERGGERLEWSALDWNELALGFYRGLGAQQMDEWVTHRLTGEDLGSSPPTPRALHPDARR